MGEWVKVEDTNPDEFGWYPVYAETADPEKPLRAVAFWNGRGWSGLVDYWQERVTHWLPWPDNPAPPPTDGDAANG